MILDLFFKFTQILSCVGILGIIFIFFKIKKVLHNKEEEKTSSVPSNRNFSFEDNFFSMWNAERGSYYNNDGLTF